MGDHYTMVFRVHFMYWFQHQPIQPDLLIIQRRGKVLSPRILRIWEEPMKRNKYFSWYLGLVGSNNANILQIHKCRKKRSRKRSILFSIWENLGLFQLLNTIENSTSYYCHLQYFNKWWKDRPLHCVCLLFQSRNYSASRYNDALLSVRIETVLVLFVRVLL